MAKNKKSLSRVAAARNDSKFVLLSIVRQELIAIEGRIEIVFADFLIWWKGSS